MWKRFCDLLVCPTCKNPLELRAFEESEVAVGQEYLRAAERDGIPRQEFSRKIESGVLLCGGCKTKYPILEGLPILLTYETPGHAVFDERYGRSSSDLAAGYEFPKREPAPGEEAVKASFSKEWLSYEYDGVIWELSYEDHESRLLTEIGPLEGLMRPRTFLEVGCGLGLTTNHAQENFDVDAVGVDLSTAPGQAARHFKDNPRLHFVQASIFSLPFAEESFDLVYSKGVLHHTYSTEAAFQRIAILCRRGGLVYIWVYGPRSIMGSPLRLALYAAERSLRPVLSRWPSSLLASALLAPLAGGYLLFNRMRRLRNPGLQPLNFERAVHAARDRFTPRFAHRHSTEEVTAWFKAAGFEQIQAVDWKDVPRADHADFGRNTAVRGIRS